MMEEDDYYGVLGVARSASKDEIKRAFKEKAKKHHPDKGGDAERFKAINEAYKVLSDDELRTRYDRFGKQGMEGVDLGGFDFFDIFGMHPHAGGGGRRSKDRLLDLEVTMEEAYRGVSVKFRFKRKVFTGDATKCPHCRGQGKIMERMTTSIGIIQNLCVCPSCAGTGTNVKESQFQTQTEVISVAVPPHCHAGYQVVIPEKADEMPNMQNGDLVLRIVIKEHDVFRLLNGRDLLWPVRIHPIEALTSFSRSCVLPSGEEVVITHMPGKPFLSTIHQWRVIPDKGLYDARRERGNLFIRFDFEEFSFAEKDRRVLAGLAGVSLPVSDSSEGVAVAGLACCDPAPIPSRQNQQQQQRHPHQPPQFHHPNVQECRPS